MSRALISDDEFISLFQKLGAAKLSRQSGVSERAIFSRRSVLEGRRNIQIQPPVPNEPFAFVPTEIPGRLHRDIENGIVVVGSDAHYWPGIISPAHRAFVKFCKEFCPKIVVMNGDVLDGATISRHPRIGWENRPTLIDEITACQERLGEITVAADKADRIWPLGNHDARLESRIAAMAPEFARVHGVHLNDHFSDWESCWSVWINDDVVVKHRYKGGIHATHNNTVNSGKTIVTGHLHSLKVSPFTDYGPTRWGVDTGTMADVFGPQFNSYLEDNPRNWRSGFAVLSFERGRLLWPELVHVLDGNTVEFRGKTYTV